MIWITSDQHFNHENIIKYSNRPFRDVEDMNESLIDVWNKNIKRNDSVYILGDFIFSSHDLYPITNILVSLNGKKYLALGDHDRGSLRRIEYFQDIRDTYFIGYKGKKFFLSHYAHYVWKQSHYDVIHCFGHSHKGLRDYEKTGQMLNVGVDNAEYNGLEPYAPYSIEKVIEIMKTRPLNRNSLKNREE